jgi:hypothetical protein
MGGTVLDRRRRDELGGALALGRLAEEMVFTLGRVLRSEALRPDDARVLEMGQKLFELMAAEQVVVVDGSDDRMLSNDSYFDALHVVEHQTQGRDVEEQARRYAELLHKIANNESLSDDELAQLASMRELFSEVGETTLAHASELSRPRQEPSWQLMRPATSRF